MSSKPELFQTVLQGGRVFQVAWIRNLFDLQALDKSCPERNGNEPSAYQGGEGQDYYCRRDGDGLLPSTIASSWSQTAGTHHCHCFPRFLAQATCERPAEVTPSARSLPDRICSIDGGMGPK